MDTTRKPPTILSVCTGYGGIERGISMVVGDLTPIAYVEIEAFACKNLVEKMEAGEMAPAPIFSDVKAFPALTVRDTVDVLVGGYPCQPFSNAGLRLGTADDQRHLWPYIRRIIRIARPKLCFFENVEGHINRGLEEVLGDLEAEGYRTTWSVFSAGEVGATHGRKRVFLMGDNGFDWDYVADADNEGLEGHAGDEQGAGPQEARQDRPLAPGSIPLRWPARPGEEQHEWEEPRLITKFNRKGE